MLIFSFIAFGYGLFCAFTGRSETTAFVCICIGVVYMAIDQIRLLRMEIQKIRKLYEDKILAEKTLSLVMRAAQESSGQ